MPAIRCHIGGVRAADDAAPGRAAGPMQHAGTGEVAAAADQRRVGREPQRFAVPELDARSLPHDPFAIVGMDMNRHIECLCPLVHRRVEMRVRDRHRLHAAERLDERNRRLVQHRDAIPQHVAVRRAQQHRALADGEARLRRDADDPRFVLMPAVHMGDRELVLRGPALTRRRHVLPLVVTDRAVRRGPVGGGILRSASRADERLHVSLNDSLRLRAPCRGRRNTQSPYTSG